MKHFKPSLELNIDNIKNLLSNNSEVIIKNFIMGKSNCVEAAIIYIDGLVNIELINNAILTPLMLHLDDDSLTRKDLQEYLCKKYITISKSYVEKDIYNALDDIKRGKTVLLVDNCDNCIVIDTIGGSFRSISEPLNESSVRGPKEGFVENLQTNLSMIRRRIRTDNLITENFTLGKVSKTDLSIVYLDNIVDKNLLCQIKEKLNSINIDSIESVGIIEQCIEDHTFSIFPQAFTTERPDKVQAHLLEGKIAILADGTPFVLTVPAIFIEFFQSVEDYYHRTIVSSFARIIRYIAVFVIIILPSLYLTLIKFNSSLIPLTFIQSIIDARKGIALTPFMSMISMNLIVEFLREGGIRLPGKIGQTLSVVGGIIIGDAAIKAKIVSSITLLVVGITTVASFLIPNYEMALAIRILSYPTLLLSNWLGMLGLSISSFFILAYLCSLDSFGVPYLKFYKTDMKDTFIRAPIKEMNTKPKVIPRNNNSKWNSLRLRFRRK